MCFTFMPAGFSSEWASIIIDIGYCFRMKKGCDSRQPQKKHITSLKKPYLFLLWSNSATEPLLTCAAVSDKMFTVQTPTDSHIQHEKKKKKSLQENNRNPTRFTSISASIIDWHDCNGLIRREENNRFRASLLHHPFFVSCCF